MEHFLDTVETIEPGQGFTHFGPEHPAASSLFAALAGAGAGHGHARVLHRSGAGRKLHVPDECGDWQPSGMVWRAHGQSSVGHPHPGRGHARSDVRAGLARVEKGAPHATWQGDLDADTTANPLGSRLFCAETAFALQMGYGIMGTHEAVLHRRTAR